MHLTLEFSFHLVDRIVNNPKSLFSRHGIKIVRYADDFVLMGKELPDVIVEKLQSLLNRMGLTINEEKTRKIEAKESSFDFLGFTIRYCKDIKGRNSHYWNITPSKKSEVKIRKIVGDYLRVHGHFKAETLVSGLNPKLRGWLNYFEIKGVSYPAMSNRRLRFYLKESLFHYYNRKSQRKSRLYRQKAFEKLVMKYQLIDPVYCFSKVRL